MLFTPKPIVAIVTMALLTSAFAANNISEKKYCGPLVDSEMGRVIHVNSPIREVASC